MITIEKLYKIKDVLAMNNGFFSHISYTFPDDISTSVLDLQFYTNYANKTVAPIVNILMDRDEVSQLTNAELNEIGQAIVQTYKHKWDKLVDVYNLEYNPIYNYKDDYEETINKVKSDTDSTVWSEDVDGLRTDNLTEGRSSQNSSSNTRTDNLTELKTNNLSEQHGGTISETSTRTDNLSELENRNLHASDNNSAAHNVFGFNSNSAVGESTNTEIDAATNTGTVTTTNTGTQGKSGSTTDTRSISNTGTVNISNSGTQSNIGTGSETSTKTNTGTQSTSSTTTGIKSNVDDATEDITRSYSHEGNIGNHPTQMLINDEIELWRWNFVQEILDDVKDFVTIPMYI